jgi:hypothetical protein
LKPIKGTRSHHLSIHAPLNDLIASLVTAGTSLAQAGVALFHLIFAFGHFWFEQFVQFAQTVIQFGFDLFRGAVGFVVGTSSTRGAPWSADTFYFLAANFFVLLILGSGGYYWWYTRTQSGKGSRVVKLRK